MFFIRLQETSLNLIKVMRGIMVQRNISKWYYLEAKIEQDILKDWNHNQNPI